MGVCTTATGQSLQPLKVGGEALLASTGTKVKIVEIRGDQALIEDPKKYESRMVSLSELKPLSFASCQPPLNPSRLFQNSSEHDYSLDQSFSTDFEKFPENRGNIIKQMESTDDKDQIEQGTLAFQHAAKTDPEIVVMAAAELKEGQFSETVGAVVQTEIRKAAQTYPDEIFQAAKQSNDPELRRFLVGILNEPVAVSAEKSSESDPRNSYSLISLPSGDTIERTERRSELLLKIGSGQGSEQAPHVTPATTETEVFGVSFSYEKPKILAITLTPMQIIQVVSETADPVKVLPLVSGGEELLANLRIMESYSPGVTQAVFQAMRSVLEPLGKSVSPSHNKSPQGGESPVILEVRFPVKIDGESRTAIRVSLVRIDFEKSKTADKIDRSNRLVEADRETFPRTFRPGAAGRRIGRESAGVDAIEGFSKSRHQKEPDPTSVVFVPVDPALTGQKPRDSRATLIASGASDRSQRRAADTAKNQKDPSGHRGDGGRDGEGDEDRRRRRSPWIEEELPA